MQDYFIARTIAFLTWFFSPLKIVENYDLSLLGNITGELLRVFHCPLPPKKGWGLQA